MRLLILTILLIALIVPAFLSGADFAQAALIDDIKSKITDRNNKLKELEEEIRKHQEELNKVSTERKTLETAVKTLDISRQKISTDIKVTENRIEATNLDISRLSLEIRDKAEKISDNSDAIGKSIRQIDELESTSMVEALLANAQLSDFWGQIDTLERFQTVVKDRLVQLRGFKLELESAKSETESKKGELLAYKGDLSDQKQALDINRQEKNKLLTSTKSQEASYQALIAEKERQKALFEQELFQLESELKIAIDPSSIPPVGSGILKWPLANPFVTQQFGKTSDSVRLYASGTHNGIDFRAAIGTPIKAALSGVIEGTGNTDLQKGCYSYGKWILIRHSNGLSTLYGHLSSINVSPGQSVITGDTIGYSGSTGYATGPHLHFTVYATQGVRIAQFSNSINCKNVSVPIADPKAYLDPMSYL